MESSDHANAPGPARLAISLRSLPVVLALIFLGIIVATAVLAPYLGTVDPTVIDPASRLKPPSGEHWLGTDAFGRDIYSRVLYGARVSLIMGLGAALASLTFGLLFGVIAGYFPLADAVIMRVMDGIMAIPGILLAVALISLTGASLATVLVAVTIPEIPRVVRLVRSVILTIRHELYVEAAISLGTRVPALLVRHMIPNTFAPLAVLGTHIFASAVLVESALSFLGLGLPAETPSWGSVMSEGRVYFQLMPGLILYAASFLALTVLSVNVLGDAMRDALDPKTAYKL